MQPWSAWVVVDPFWNQWEYRHLPRSKKSTGWYFRTPPARKLTKKTEIMKKTPQGWFAMQPSLVRRYGRFASIIPNGLTLIVQNPKWPRCSIWIYQRGGITRVDGKQDVESTFLVIVCWICSQRGYAMYTRFIISCINYKLYNNLQWIYMVTPPPQDRGEHLIYFIKDLRLRVCSIHVYLRSIDLCWYCMQQRRSRILNFGNYLSWERNSCSSCIH